jgi:hypothetical protein
MAVAGHWTDVFGGWAATPSRGVSTQLKIEILRWLKIAWRPFHQPKMQPLRISPGKMARVSLGKPVQRRRLAPQPDLRAGVIFGCSPVVISPFS